MSLDGHELDPTDQAYVDELVPDGCMYVGHLSIVEWITPDGDSRWRVYSQMDQPVSSIVGMLEMAKLHMCARLPPESSEVLGLRSIIDDD